jgi:GT2 family glycosyltransferase
MIDIAIVSYGSKNDIKANLALLSNSGLINAIFVLENSKAHASDWESFSVGTVDFHVILSEENLGYGAGVRKLLDQIASSHCLILNPDCRPIEGALEILLQHQSDCNCVLVSGTLLNGLGDLDSYFPYVNLLTSQPTQVGPKKNVNSIFRMSIFPGAFFLVDIERYRNSDGYSKMFLYFDEMDTVCQLSRNNQVFHLLDIPVGIHSRASTTGDSFSKKTPFTAYWSTRNAIVVWEEYFPWYLPSILVFRLMNALRYFFIGNYRASYATLSGICRGLCLTFNCVRRSR